MATFSATSTVTAPSAVGVTVKVYTRFDTAVKSLAVPLPIVTSSSSKPVTASEKVAVTSKAALVVALAVVLNVTDGRVVSAGGAGADAVVKFSVVASGMPA